MASPAAVMRDSGLAPGYSSSLMTLRSGSRMNRLRMSLNVNRPVIGMSRDGEDEGFDVVIRVAELKDSNLVSQRITASRGLTVAAPAYLDRRGRPAHPADLAAHDCTS